MSTPHIWWRHLKSRPSSSYLNIQRCLEVVFDSIDGNFGWHISICSRTSIAEKRFNNSALLQDTFALDHLNFCRKSSFITALFDNGRPIMSHCQIWRRYLKLWTSYSIEKFPVWRTRVPPWRLTLTYEKLKLAELAVLDIVNKFYGNYS